MYFPSLVFQETEIDILSTVQNLLRQCSNPASFLKPISRLFSILHNKLPRQALTSVFQVGPRSLTPDVCVLLRSLIFTSLAAEAGPYVLPVTHI